MCGSMENRERKTRLALSMALNTDEQIQEESLYIVMLISYVFFYI